MLQIAACFIVTIVSWEHLAPLQTNFSHCVVATNNSSCRREITLQHQCFFIMDLLLFSEKDFASLALMLQFVQNNVYGCPYYMLGLPILSCKENCKKRYHELLQKFHPSIENCADPIQVLPHAYNAYRFLMNDCWKASFDSFVHDSKYEDLNHEAFSQMCCNGKFDGDGRHVMNLRKDSVAVVSLGTVVAANECVIDLPICDAEAMKNSQKKSKNVKNDICRKGAAKDYAYILYNDGQWYGSSDSLSVELSAYWVRKNLKKSFVGLCIAKEGRQQKNPSSDLLEGERQFSRLCFLKNEWYGVKGIYREKLSISYVRSNFSSSFIRRCQNNPGADELVAVGNAKDSFKPATAIITSPPVLMQNGEPTCAIKSIASAFMFFNDEKVCKILLDNTINSVAASDRIMYIKHLLIDTHKLGYREKIFKTGDGSLNILKDISCYPTIARVQGADGSIGHCISVARKWVFDSNKPAASLLTLESLNWCCSSDSSNNSFLNVFFAVRFYHNKPRREWKLCDSCRKLGRCNYNNLLLK